LFAGFFAHHPRDVRVHEHSAQLAALEAQLQASDPSFAAPHVGGQRAAAAGSGGVSGGRREGDGSKADQHKANGFGENKGGQRPNPAHSDHHLGSSHSVDSFQAEQLRQLQAALAGSPLLMGLGGGCGGGAGMPAHASSAAAAAALLEAALQPGTPPSSGPHAHLPSPAGSLSRGLSHALAHGGDDMSGMGATMRLLSGLSGQLPAGVAEQVQAGADVSAALAAIGTLSALVDKARVGAAGHDLMQVLCGALPALAMQAQQAAAAAAAAQQHAQQQQALQQGFGHPSHGHGHHGHHHHHAHRHHQTSMMGPIGGPVHGGGLLASCASAPVPAPLSARVHRDSDGTASPPSGALTDRGCTGSVSSRLSDGSRSPSLSHHSDEGLRCGSGHGHHGLYSSPSQRLAALNLDSSISAPATARGESPHSGMQQYEQQPDGRSLADCLPLSLSRPGSNADLSGMVDMDGAESAMIASLSELVDSGLDGQLQSNGSVGSGDRSLSHSLDAPLHALTLPSS
jgi:hypothetical protein